MKKNLPLIFVSVFLLMLIVVLILLVFRSTQGHLVYSFDDAYIHMAISKNLAIHGMWGVSYHEFSSSSSSLVWTLLLAAVYYIFTPNEITPFIFNIIPAFFILVSVFLILKKYDISNFKYMFAVLMLFVFLPPLPPLIFTGLEHVLHILIAIIFIYYAVETLSGNYNKKNLFFAAISSILLPVIRYEGIIIVAGFCLLLVFQRKWFVSILILILSLLPVFVFGSVSISNGWSFFPNSLLLKAGFPDVYSIDDFLAFIVIIVSSFITGVNPYLFITVFFTFIVLVSAYLIYRKPVWLKSRNFSLLALLLFNISLYLVYSRSGWSYRYQSFIISLSIFVLSVILYKYFSYSRLIVKWKIYSVRIITIIAVLLLGFNGIRLMYDVPTTTRNIYEQQYQMGIFLNDYYRGSSIALNDIGTSNYFADIKCVDLWGLSNLEISKLRRTGNITEQNIREITLKNNVRIAIVYDSWFEEDGRVMLPKEWIKAGEWAINDNIIAGDDVISFYAVNENEAIQLENNLKLFSEKLPNKVIQKGKYLN